MNCKTAEFIWKRGFFVKQMKRTCLKKYLYVLVKQVGWTVVPTYSKENLTLRRGEKWVFLRREEILSIEGESSTPEGLYQNIARYLARRESVL